MDEDRGKSMIAQPRVEATKRDGRGRPVRPSVLFLSVAPLRCHSMPLQCTQEQAKRTGSQLSLARIVGAMQSCSTIGVRVATATAQLSVERT